MSNSDIEDLMAARVRPIEQSEPRPEPEPKPGLPKPVWIGDPIDPDTEAKLIESPVYINIDSLMNNFKASVDRALAMMEMLNPENIDRIQASPAHIAMLHDEAHLLFYHQTLLSRRIQEVMATMHENVVEKRGVESHASVVRDAYADGVEEAS